MSIVKQEDRSGVVTFQNRVYMGGVLFKINHQYPFDRVVWLEIGCGCGGVDKKHVKHYSVCASGNSFFIDAKYLVETTVPIPEDAQDFDIARRDQHRNPGTDFSDIVNNPDPAKIWNVAQEQARDK